MAVSRESEEKRGCQGAWGVMAGTFNPRKFRQKDLREWDEENTFGMESQWSLLEKMGVLAPNLGKG